MGRMVRGSKPYRGGEIFRNCPDRHSVHPALYITDTGPFQGLKRKRLYFTFTSLYYSFFFPAVSNLSSLSFHFLHYFLSSSFPFYVFLLSFTPFSFRNVYVSYYIIYFLHLFLSVLNIVLSNPNNCLKCRPVY